MVETIDAAEALGYVDLAERTAVKATLEATLVKHARHREVFSLTFDVYFAPGAASAGTEEEARSSPPEDDSAEALQSALRDALGRGDGGLLDALAREAVRRFARMEVGRPVGGLYYLYRTLRAVNLDGAVSELLDERDGLDHRLRSEEIGERAARFRAAVEAEIRRRLVADRGPDAVAETLRRPASEDVALMHATRDELEEIEKAIEPLTRKLASRLGMLRRHGRAGRLDFRRTVRRSLGSGGVPFDPVFRPRKPTRPDIWLVTDLSGSMATFARFTLQFVYAMSSHLSKLRAFAFIDGLDEVTGLFGPGVDFAEAVEGLHDTAEILWFDGHSDYGHALEVFWSRYGAELTSKVTVIVAGDARSNYRDPRPELLERIRAHVRAVYWLNPESRAYWNTGDSVMRAYEPYCTDVFEVRSLRHLEAFVRDVTAPRHARSS